MKRPLFLALAAAFTLASSTVYAQDDRMYKPNQGARDDGWWDDDRLYKDNGDWYEGWSEARFRGLDRNRDGVVTRNEWRGNDNSFERMDRNNDGILSGNEVRRRGAQRVRYGNRDNATQQLFRGWDRNRDGRIGRNEWPGDSNAFYSLDSNRDGRLTRSEVRNRIYFY